LPMKGDIEIKKEEERGELGVIKRKKRRNGSSISTHVR